MDVTKRTTPDRRTPAVLDRAKDVAAGPNDDPPNSVVIDATLTHLLESRHNLDQARSEMDPTTIQKFNTSVLGLRYRTSIESRWR